MILSTHAIVGAAIASFLPSHSTTAFVLGFASHFVLDTIPHWDYPIRSASVDTEIGAPVTFDRALLRDVVVIGSDGLIGNMTRIRSRTFQFERHPQLNALSFASALAVSRT